MQDEDDRALDPLPCGPRKERKDLSQAARRALAEAEERRRAAQKPEARKEINGREGLEPTRYGDWEVKGIASDF